MVIGASWLLEEVLSEESCRIAQSGRRPGLGKKEYEPFDLDKFSQ
ncbi:hypothetical protein ACTHRH_23535 [Paenibacillus sp. SAFN-117]